MTVHVSYAARPCRGEERSGDAVVVRVEPSGTLLALVDALGHGDLAAETAGKATRFLDTADLASGLRAIMSELHDEMRATRGAAATLCLLRGDVFEASGVGNVGLRAFGANIGLVLSCGILGSRLRKLSVFDGRVPRSARVVLFSDGIRPTFEREDATDGSPQSACERLLTKYARAEDDATVLVADVSAEPS